jgi:predicted P-loop ATPase
MTDFSNPLIAALAPLVARVRHDISGLRQAAGHYTKTNVALDDETIARHLNGGPVRGAYPMLPGSQETLVAVLDFDDHDKDMPWDQMSDKVERVADLLELSWGLSPILFRSGGGRGVHLYLLWDEPQDAYSVRMLLKQALACVGLEDGPGGVRKGKCECFPKQDRLNAEGAGSVGNLFMLPFARASEWLVIDSLAGMLVPAGRPFTAADWVLSDPVPVHERPRRALAVRDESVSAGGAVVPWQAAPWRAALDVLAAEGSPWRAGVERSAWVACVFAIHYETGGSEDGRELAHAWSAQLPGYDGQRLDYEWERLDASRPDATRAGTILRYAREVRGWEPPIDVSGFDVVVDPVDTARAAEREKQTPGASAWPGEDADDPHYDRERSGAIKATVTNTVNAVRIPRIVGTRVAWDEFRDEITVSAPGVDEWAPMTDADAVRIRMKLEMVGFKSAGKEQVRDAVVLVAAEHRYDSARMWLQGVVGRWDGVRRVDSFMVRYLGVADSPYARAVGRYVWTALAGRVLQPGCQADMVPILSGAQGLRKSSAIAALSPAPEFFTEVDLAEDEDKTVRKLRGTLVAELAELSGLGTRALEDIKKYVTRRREKWVPKYKEFPTTFHRRVVHFGTTNRTDILADETGERRWLPVTITCTDVEAIERDREQLWAEGALMFSGALAAETGADVGDGCGVVVWGRADGEVAGVAWRDAEMLAVTCEVHANYTADDPWADAVEAWLAGHDPADEMTGSGVGPVRSTTDFAMADVLTGAIGLPLREQGMREQKRAAAILRRFGYDNKPMRRGGRLAKRWWRGEG